MIHIIKCEEKHGEIFYRSLNFIVVYYYNFIVINFFIGSRVILERDL